VTKTTKRNVFQLSAIAAAMALSATGSFAAGLGKITVLSALGQPLHAEIDVSAAREELVSMSARLASPEAFKQVGIEYAPGVSGIRFLVDKRKDGQTFLRVTSDRAINEPFLDVLVELTWSSGRMVREYTLLLDPPEAISKAVPAPVATPEAAKQAAAGAAPATTAAPAAAQAAPAAPAAPAAKPVAKPAAAAVPAPSAAKDGEDAGTRLVKSGDTLSKIATATKPEGVSLDQMLVALFRGNPEAFEGGNMNRLRAGKILNVPGADAASAVASVEARQIIVAQARDFNAYRRPLPQRQPSKTPRSSRIRARLRPRWRTRRPRLSLPRTSWRYPVLNWRKTTRPFRDALRLWKRTWLHVIGRSRKRIVVLASWNAICPTSRSWPR
jgi:pilus assembly protein FimV